MCFCIVPIDGEELAVTIKWPDDCLPINGDGILQVQKLADDDAKTMTTARRPTALLTLSRQQDFSRYTNYDKWV
jgi:hypothetical protein